MNLESAKVTSEEKVELCKKYFYLGWLALPFVWGINAVWFYKEAFIKPEFPGQVRRVSNYLKNTEVLEYLINFGLKECSSSSIALAFYF